MTALQLDYMLAQENHCREEAERPGSNREAWLNMAAQWAELRQRLEANAAPAPKTENAA
jgi:hypothetical protein